MWGIWGRRIHSETLMIGLPRHIAGASVGIEYSTIVVGIFAYRIFLKVSGRVRFEVVEAKCPALVWEGYVPWTSRLHQRLTRGCKGYTYPRLSIHLYLPQELLDH